MNFFGKCFRCSKILKAGLVAKQFITMNCFATRPAFNSCMILHAADQLQNRDHALSSHKVPFCGRLRKMGESMKMLDKNICFRVNGLKILQFFWTNLYHGLFLIFHGSVSSLYLLVSASHAPHRWLAKSMPLVTGIYSTIGLKVIYIYLKLRASLVPCGNRPRRTSITRHGNDPNGFQDIDISIASKYIMHCTSLPQKLSYLTKWRIPENWTLICLDHIW